MSKGKKTERRKLKVEDVRNRVVEMRHMRVDSLRSHPLNWRTHDDAQMGALEGSLRELGWVGCTFARVVTAGERYVEEGKLSVGDVCTLDGHCRERVLPPEYEVTVIILDLTEDEGNKFLAVYDPISALAGQDDHTFAELLSNVHTNDKFIEQMLADLYTVPSNDDDGDGENTDGDDDSSKKFQVLITCEGEEHQAEVLTLLSEQLAPSGTPLNVKALIG